MSEVPEELDAIMGQILSPFVGTNAATLHVLVRSGLCTKAEYQELVDRYSKMSIEDWMKEA